MVYFYVFLSRNVNEEAMNVGTIFLAIVLDITGCKVVSIAVFILLMIELENLDPISCIKNYFICVRFNNGANCLTR